jgi:hypothetical protein
MDNHEIIFNNNEIRKELIIYMNEHELNNLLHELHIIEFTWWSVYVGL